MPDFDRLDQIHQLANLLSSMPPQQLGGVRIPIPQPKRAQWATELVDKFGVRVHPDLASMELVPDPDTDASMGANRPQRMQRVGPQPQQVMPRVDAAALLKMLRDVGETQNVPSLIVLADRVEAARTDEQRKMVIAEIHRENPGLIATMRRDLDEADPVQVFGQ